MTTPQDVYADLVAEGDDIDRLVAGLDATGWNQPTPASGWTIAHQVAHLAFIAHLAALAASDTQAFETEAAPARIDFQATVDAKLAEYLAEPQQAVIERWRTERALAAKALAAVPAGEMVPWLVNPLPPSILAAAGIMELFGHGQDIADTLGIKRDHDDRVLHLTAFGTRTMAFGYLAHNTAPPPEEFRFELTSPSGTLWEFGPADSPHKITGPAVDFCLLITRRRHRDDLDLHANNPTADHWLDIAQAYRGPAGNGRTPGQFNH